MRNVKTTNNKQQTINRRIPEGIYVAITEEFCRNGSALKTLSQALKGGAGIIQLREKHYSKSKILKMARSFRKITKKAGAMFIVNDRLDIALAVKADGVHLGPEDMPVKKGKKKPGRLVIGASAYSVKEALKAQRDGADYVNIGPVFATRTKKLKVRPVGLAGVKKTVKKLRIPVTVMGGIKERHIPGLVKAGARRIAVITDVSRAKDVRKKVKRLQEKILNES